VRDARHSQTRVHLVECAVRLAEEVEHDALAELTVDLVLVHLENLLKRRRVDGVVGAGDRHDAVDGALSWWSVCVGVGVGVRGRPRAVSAESPDRETARVEREAEARGGGQARCARDLDEEGGANEPCRR
jgi:hypothetical protein